MERLERDGTFEHDIQVTSPFSPSLSLQILFQQKNLNRFLSEFEKYHLWLRGATYFSSDNINYSQAIQGKHLRFFRKTYGFLFSQKKLQGHTPFWRWIKIILVWKPVSADIYLFKVDMEILKQKNSSISLKFTVKTQKRDQRRHSGIFLLTLNRFRTLLWCFHS